jgi:hypothetical protein
LGEPCGSFLVFEHERDTGAPILGQAVSYTTPRPQSRTDDDPTFGIALGGVEPPLRPAMGGVPGV